MIKNIKIKIFGRVQGVWFRESTKKKARELGVAGWVKNEPDGSVHAEAEGEEDKIEEFMKWCHEGSELSKVERVEVEESKDLKGYKNFKVRY
ncbi:acylphosphatase [Candidatus Falkowbacteria bacterium]|nr:MAG: acylphosphatase [Candidatus Falkowbacteria bacterium]